MSKFDFKLIKDNALAGHGCSAEEAMYLVNEVELKELCKSAGEIRDSLLGKKVDLCMIVNAKSGVCSNDCKFCSQSVHYNTDVTKYPLLSSEELIASIKEAEGKSDCFGIVTSGATVNDAELEIICQAVKNTVQRGKINVCASLGKLSETQLKKLKSAGLKRYHHNLEAGQEYYSQICSTQSWQERVDTVKRAVGVGLEVCSGGLFGLGESWEDRISMACTLRDAGISNIPLNFLYPHAGTPMEKQGVLETDEGLKIIAVYRHLIPQATLRVCGGRPSTLGERQKEIFSAGANAMMTGNYLTTSGITPESDIKMILETGMDVL